MQYIKIFAATLLIIAAIGLSSCTDDSQELDQQIEKLEQLITTAQTELAALRNENKTQTDFKTLETELLKLSGELTKLRKDHGTTSTDLSTL